jgi:tousled-like kinase
LFGQKPFGNGMTQEKIFQENVIRRAKKVEFPEKPIISNDCKVKFN